MADYSSKVDPKTGRPTRRWWGWRLPVSLFVIRSGCRLPWGYGIAWSRPWNDTFILIPIPLNWVARALRWAYYALAATRNPSAIDRLTQASWRAGFDAGRRVHERLDDKE